MSRMPTTSEKERVRAIVRRWGWNGTSYQILNPGFKFWLDDARDAAVGYVECHGVRVVGGAPVCPRHQFLDVVCDFERDAAAHDMGVVYFGGERRVAAMARHDARRTTFPIGAQPVWRPSTLLREFDAHASLRAQLNRARNKGVSVHAVEHITTQLQNQLHQCLQDWVQRRGLPALHFLIETETLSDIVDRRVVVAERAGELVGFLLATPIPARNGWLVEQIVRGRNAPNGTNELLLHCAAERLEQNGAAMVTLGLAPLARRGRPAVDSAPRWLDGLLHMLRAHGRHFYNFEGLEAFKSKFGGSRWESVYASLAPGTALPKALLAITAAFSGEPLRRFVPRVLVRGIRREIHRTVVAD
jgi:phosphatidylglycerol lysyltransferase